MDPAEGFDFYLRFPLRICARNPTMASELLAKHFNSVMCLIYISMYVILHVFLMLQDVYIYVCMYMF